MPVKELYSRFSVIVCRETETRAQEAEERASTAELELKEALQKHDNIYIYHCCL